MRAVMVIFITIKRKENAMNNEIDLDKLAPFSALKFDNDMQMYHSRELDLWFVGEYDYGVHIEYLKKTAQRNKEKSTVESVDKPTKTAKQTATKRKKVAPVSVEPTPEIIPHDASNKPVSGYYARTEKFNPDDHPTADFLKLNQEKIAPKNPQIQPSNDNSLLRHIDNNHLVKRLTNTLSASIQLPKNTVFLIGLSIFSSVATRKYSVAYEYGGSIPIGLYVVAEQPPATAKTWLQREFQKPFDDVDDENRKNRKEQLEDLRNQLDDCEDKEGAKELKKQIKEIEKNTIPLLFITNTTPEALEMSLHDTRGFFSLVSSEQTLFDSLLGLINGDGKQNNNEVVLNGFDGGKSGTLRVTREAYSGRAIGGVSLFAQNGSIEKVLNASNGTGLSERFLMLAEPHNLGKRNHINAPYIDRTITAEYHKLSSDLARLALKNDGEVSTLTISKEAHRKIRYFQQGIESHIGDSGAYAAHQSLRGSSGKANMQIMKIAANLHLLDGGAYQPEIEDKHVDSAIWIVDAVLKSMLALCHEKEIIGSKAEYNAIIGYLSGKRDGLKSAEIVEGVRNKKPFKDMTGKKPDAIRMTLSEMIARNLLTQLNGIYSVS